MNVLLFHPCKLPPRDYGGTERVVGWLARGLVEAGHEVWVAAYPGSNLPPGVRLLEVSPHESSALDVIPRFPLGLDVVHFMAPPGDAAIMAVPCPSVVTVHGNGKPDEIFPRNTVFLSEDHARRHGSGVFVHNGIDPDELMYRPQSKRDRFLFLSRTGWRVKNLAGAMQFSSAAAVPLDVAGGYRPWRLHIASWLKPGIRWQGPVSGARKAELLSAASALIFPVLWDEPFGLVVVEALCSGTPVVAPARGSLPELIDDSTGALLPDPAHNPETWIRTLKSIASRELVWDPEACRARALALFHYRKMALSYAALYSKVMSGQSLNSEFPRTVGDTKKFGMKEKR